MDLAANFQGWWAFSFAAIAAAEPLELQKKLLRSYWSSNVSTSALLALLALTRSGYE